MLAVTKFGKLSFDHHRIQMAGFKFSGWASYEDAYAEELRAVIRYMQGLYAVGGDSWTPKNLVLDLVVHPGVIQKRWFSNELVCKEWNILGTMPNLALGVAIVYAYDKITREIARLEEVQREEKEARVTKAADRALAAAKESENRPKSSTLKVTNLSTGRSTYSTHTPSSSSPSRKWTGRDDLDMNNVMLTQSTLSSLNSSYDSSYDCSSSYSSGGDSCGGGGGGSD